MKEKTMEDLENLSLVFAIVFMFGETISFFSQGRYVPISFFIAAISLLMAYLIKRARYSRLENELEKTKKELKETEIALHNPLKTIKHND